MSLFPADDLGLIAMLDMINGIDYRAWSNFVSKAKFARTRAAWKRLLYGHDNSNSAK